MALAKQQVRAAKFLGIAVNKVSYEWWVEEVDADDDIQECYEIDFKEWPVEPRENLTARLCLRRLRGNDVEGCSVWVMPISRTASWRKNFPAATRFPSRS